MSKEYTKEEMRQIFLDRCEHITEYWINNDRAKSSRDKVEGAIFSIMNIFDGTCGGFPAAIDLVLRPHPDDKQYHIDNGDNWLKDGMVINDDCHLHEIIFQRKQLETTKGEE